MTKLTRQNLIKTCEVASLNAPIKAFMGAIGASESLAYSWRAKCAADRKANNLDSVFYFRWREVERFWDQHIEAARIEWVVGFESELRHQCRFGREEIVRDGNQQIVWKLDPDLLNLSDEDLLNICGRTDRYLLDENGHRVAETKTVWPSQAVILRVLEQDRRYLAQQNINVESRVEEVHIIKRHGADGPRPDLEQLRAMVAERRRLHPPGSKPSYPHDGHGRFIPADLGVKPGDNRPDDGAELAKPPNPRAYNIDPLSPAIKPQPSYARPARSLDQSGRGAGVPPVGGFRVKL